MSGHLEEPIRDVPGAALARLPPGGRPATLATAGRFPAEAMPADGSQLLVVVYHHLAIDADPLTDQLNVTTTPERFAQHLRYFARNYDLIAPSDLFAARLPSRALLVTFDDAYRSVLDIAGPLLRTASVRSVFFLNPTSVDGQTLPIDNLISLALNRLGCRTLMRMLGVSGTLMVPSTSRLFQALAKMPEESLLPFKDEVLRRLGLDERSVRRNSRLFLDAADLPRLGGYGIEIGNHSMNHRFLRGLSTHRLHEEIAQSRTRLATLSGQPVDYFAVPYGHLADLSDTALRAARESGHRAIFLVHGRSNRHRPEPDVYFRVSVENVPVSLLPLVLGTLPRLRTALAALTGSRKKRI